MAPTEKQSTRPTPAAERDPVSERTLDARIARARAHCQERRLNFTPQREAVHRALLAVDGPVKAYDLLTRMQRETPGLAAMTVYRALDFLIDAGLIHKIAATASFVPCAHEGEHTHGQVAFLVCKRCGAVDEVQAEGIVDALDRAKPHRTGFTMQSIEVHGLCADCAGTASSDCAGTAS